MLCERCSNIHFTRLTSVQLPVTETTNWKHVDHVEENEENEKYVYYFLYPNEQALRTSAAAGCHFCVMLLHAFLDGMNFFRPANDIDGNIDKNCVYLRRHWEDRIITEKGSSYMASHGSHIYAIHNGKSYGVSVCDIRESVKKQISWLHLCPLLTQFQAS